MSNAQNLPKKIISEGESDAATAATLPAEDADRSKDQGAYESTIAAPSSEGAQVYGSERFSPSRFPVTERAGYVVQGEVARGGIGRILRASDAHLDRPVAIKELLGGGGAERERFVREALLTARLQHPSIVPLYEAGRWPSGEPFYSMKLVTGRSLAYVIAKQRSFEERLALLGHVIAAANAMAYAHSEGIIHRDLKPDNILVGAFGETVVIDWGLAKDLRSAEQEPPVRVPPVPAPWGASSPGDLTVAGSIMGTPAYMAPEQAEGQPLNERADVYALGAILYHLLAGVPPYDGDNAMQIVKKVRDTAPEPLPSRQEGIPQDLLAIVKKAMARDPSERYATAKELALDLRLFETGQIVGAHTYSPRELLSRFVRRYRAPLSVAVLALVVLGVVGALALRSVISSRDLAHAKQKEAVLRADQVTLAQARTSLDRDPNETLRWLMSLSPSFDRWRTLRVIAADAQERGLATVLQGHTKPINHLVYSPDGRMIISGSDDSDVRLWDIESGSVRVLRGHSDEVYLLIFTPDGKYFVTSSKDKTVRLWEVASGSSRVLAKHKGEVHALAMSSDGRMVASGGRDGSVLVVELKGGEPRSFTGHHGGISGLDFSHDGQWLVSTSTDTSTRLWELSRGEATAVFENGREARDAAFSPDDRYVAWGVYDGTARLLDRSSGVVRTLAGHSDRVTTLAFSPDGKTLATGGLDHTLRLWELESGASRVLTGHRGRVWDLRFSSDGKWLASVSRDHSARLWDIKTGEVRVLRGFQDSTSDVAFSPDNRSLAISSWDNTIRLFPVEPGVSRTVARLDIEPKEASLSPDQRSLVTSSAGGEARLVNLEDGRSIPLEGHIGPIRKVAFSPRGDIAASGGEDGTVRLWDLEGHEVLTLCKQERPVVSLAFSPDGKLVGSGHEGGRIVLGDVDSGEERVLASGDMNPTLLVFSPEGGRLASAGLDHTVRVFDIVSGAVSVLRGHDGLLETLTFSPSGRRIASGSHDHTLRLWDAGGGAALSVLPSGGPTLEEILFTSDENYAVAIGNETVGRVWDLRRGAEHQQLHGHEEDILSAAIAPDNITIATASGDATVRLWDLPSRESRALRGHRGAVLGVWFSQDGVTITSISADRTIRKWIDDLPQDPDALRAWLRLASTRAVDLTVRRAP